MALQGALFLPSSGWKPPKLGELPSWTLAKRVSVDVETYDPQLSELGPGVRRGGYIAGVAFAIEDGPGFYLPIAHEGGDNLDKGAVLNYLREQAKNYTQTIVGTNLQYDLDFLAEAGVSFDRAAWFRDVQVAEPLLDELQDQYNLDAIARRHKIRGKDYVLLKDALDAYGLKGRPGKHIYKIPARFVGEYATQDVFLPLELIRHQERLLEEQDLWAIYDLESRVLPVLLKMRRRGVRFSHDRLAQVEKWSETEEQKALDVVTEHTGYQIGLGDVWAAEPFNTVLKKIGVVAPLTPKGKPSITADFLESIDHPAARAMARARQVNKLRSTFVNSIRTYAIGDRIHCLINQLKKENDSGELGGAAFGRCSSEHPNLQQQPARDPEMGPLWRSIYIPDEGGEWASADFSQQEPRMLTYYAERARCKGAAAAAQRYRDDPNTDNHAMMAELTGLPRKQAKNIFLGKCYGMGGAKLCREVGLPTKWEYSEKFKRMIEVAGPEGAAILEQFDRRAPYVKQLAKLCEDRAKKNGYIITFLGRRCRFPLGENGEYDWTYKALNRLIQGGCGDQIKAAMVAADAAGYGIQLQVHDELDLTVIDRQEAEGLAEIMCNAIQLGIPSKVDVEIGPSWGECK